MGKAKDIRVTDFFLKPSGYNGSFTGVKVIPYVTDEFGGYRYDEKKALVIDYGELKDLLKRQNFEQVENSRWKYPRLVVKR
jgi:hypothetical protein